MAQDTSLIKSLVNPGAFAYAATNIKLIETHISWVILAGDYVYKIKKPVKLDFLDFGDLGKRKFYCEEEIRLNKPWAPEIYLDVVPITVENGQAKFGGEGEAIEYAVRMHRFDQDRLLNRELERGSLTTEDMDELGAHVAERHLAAELVDTSRRARVIGLTKQFMWDNFTALEGVIPGTDMRDIRDWTELELRELDTTIAQRFDAGFFRNCHGDLHLRNLVRLPSGITAFDCIEFDEDLRHIDVFCDIAFLLIDLVARRHHDLAAHFLNRYLERTGDYEGMAVFSLYFVYRCLVRAKVAAIRFAERTDKSAAADDRREVLDYCDMARRQIAPRFPILVIMSGLSGSGKTWVSTRLMGAMPAVRIRSDIERKRMFGLDEAEKSLSGVGQGIYTKKASRRVYERLFGAARTMLVAGHNVILDAAFLSRADRAAASDIARKCECTAVILAVSAPLEIMRQRVRARERSAADASEAGLQVLEHQLTIVDPVTDGEAAQIVRLENVANVDVAAVASGIKARAKKDHEVSA